jgi:hypothetical protein
LSALHDVRRFEPVRAMNDRDPACKWCVIEGGLPLAVRDVPQLYARNPRDAQDPLAAMCVRDASRALAGGGIPHLDAPVGGSRSNAVASDVRELEDGVCTRKKDAATKPV